MPTGAELATAWLAIKPSMDGVQGDLTKQLVPAAEGAGDEAGKKAGGRMSAGLKAALAVGGALAIAGVVKVFQTGIEELKFGEQINAQTQLLIDNTGFKGSVDQINDYTLALSQLSGISEEDLQQAGNNILKFGNVSEENYQKAVSSINDLGAAGKDVGGVSEALAKSLADPTNAASLLKRQGVLLTDQQKEQIKTFTEAGDVASAQGVILDSLEGTYGGMAEAAGGTLTGNLNKLQNSFENLAGDIVTMAMPAVEGIVTGLQGFVAWLGQNQGVIVAVAAIIGVTLVAAFIAWAASIWATTIALLANPITWIILAIIALVAAIVWLVLNWDTVVKWITDIWAGFIGWITGVIDGFVGWWNGIWTAVGDFINTVWNNIRTWIIQQFLNVYSFLVSTGRNITNWWNGLWNGVVNFFRDAWANIVRVVATIQSAFGAAFENIAGVVRGAFSGVVGVVRGVVNSVIGVVNGAIGGINNLTAAASAVGVNIPRIPTIPMLAKGGTITGAGSVIVGERGPELLNLPRGASVNPDIPDGLGGPRELVIVDADGALIGRMQVEADGVVTARGRSSATDISGGRRRS